MKNAMKLYLAGAALFAAIIPAHAEQKAKAEVMTSWTSGGEAAALDVF
jgi:glucose/mannose transport system substrate-binding protein